MVADSSAMERAPSRNQPSDEAVFDEHCGCVRSTGLYTLPSVKNTADIRFPFIFEARRGAHGAGDFNCALSRSLAGASHLSIEATRRSW